MVIVILGIFAAVALPKFVNFKNRAIERSEDAVAGALSTAIKINYLSYITAGGDPSTSPAVNPFTLLEQAPPDTIATDPMTPDGTFWKYAHEAGYRWFIYCPHRDGSIMGSTGTTKGRRYCYQYVVYQSWKPGDFWLVSDFGH